MVVDIGGGSFCVIPRIPCPGLGGLAHSCGFPTSCYGYHVLRFSLTTSHGSHLLDPRLCLSAWLSRRGPYRFNTQSWLSDHSPLKLMLEDPFLPRLLPRFVCNLILTSTPREVAHNPIGIIYGAAAATVRHDTSPFLCVPGLNCSLHRACGGHKGHIDRRGRIQPR